MRLTSRWVRNAVPCELTRLQFYNQSKSGEERRPSLSFLSKEDIMFSSLTPPSGCTEEFSCPWVVKLVPHIIDFYVCREHTLGIINLLSSLGRIWVSYHYCFIVWGYVLLSSKPAFLSHHWLTWLSHLFSSYSSLEGNGNPLQCSCLENPRDGSLVGCHLWGRTESDTTEVT